jgi:hypothetical protein
MYHLVRFASVVFVVLDALDWPSVFAIYYKMKDVKIPHFLEKFDYNFVSTVALADH